MFVSKLGRNLTSLIFAAFVVFCGFSLSAAENPAVCQNSCKALLDTYQMALAAKNNPNLDLSQQTALEKESFDSEAAKISRRLRTAGMLLRRNPNFDDADRKSLIEAMSRVEAVKISMLQLDRDGYFFHLNILIEELEKICRKHCSHDDLEQINKVFA